MNNSILTQNEANLSEKENSFQEDMKILLDACQNIHSESLTPDFFLDKIKRLMNHLQELLKEKDKLDKEFQQTHEKVNENRHLIMKRLNNLENLLCSSTVLNKFFELQMGEILLDEIKKTKSIRMEMGFVGCKVTSTDINDQILSKVSSVSQLDKKIEESETKENVDILRLRLHQHAGNEQNRIAKVKKASTETSRISKRLHQTQDELKAVKKKSEDRIITIEQYEKERILELSKLKSEANMLRMQLIQTQYELKDSINIIQQHAHHEQETMLEINKLKSEANMCKVQLIQTQEKLLAVKKESEDRINIIRQHTYQERGRISEITNLKSEAKILKIKFILTQDELKAVEKELEDRNNIIIQHDLSEQERNVENNKLKSEANMFRIQLTQAQDELKIVKHDLEDRINIIRQHAHHEQKRNLEIRRLKSEANMCQIQLTQTQADYEAVSKNAPSQQKRSADLNKAELYQLRNKLSETQQELEYVKKTMSFKENAIEENVQHERKIMEQLNKSVEDVNTLQNQLAQTRNELEDLKKEKAELYQLRNKLSETQQELDYVKKMMSFKENAIQQNVQHKRKITEQLNKAVEDINTLQNQLAQTRNELEDLKKERNDKIHTIQENNQHEQKEEAEEVSLLRIDLAGTQHELEIVRKELGCRINDIEENNQLEKKAMEELNKAEVNILLNQLAATQHELNEVKKVFVCSMNTIQHKDIHDQQIIEKLHKMKEEEVQALQNQLAGAQRELETVRIELNDTVNNIERNVQWEQKVAEVRFSEIRLKLLKKLGFTDENKQPFENYMLEKCCRGMMSDIRRLIEDKVQLWEESIPATANGSDILQVTENEVHLVISIASYLKIIPFSANTDFIYSFVSQIDNIISRQHVEDFAEEIPNSFQRGIRWSWVLG